MRGRIQALLHGSLLAATLLLANGIVVPSPALACSCAPPEPIAQAAGPRRAIVVASIGRPVPGGTAIGIEGVFAGPINSDQMLIRGIGGESSACEHGAIAGQRWLLILFRDDDGMYSTNSCLPGALLGTADGDAKLAEAVAAFGQPGVAATPQPEPPAPIDFSPWLGGLGWVVAVVAAGAVLLGLVAVVARRRPSD
jgi:hypothetical protein